LQYDLLGFRRYYELVGANSLLSANQDGKEGWEHKNFWTETWANHLAREYFGSGGWNNRRFPVQNISPEDRLKLLNY